MEETTPSVLAPFGSSAVDLEGIHPETFYFLLFPFVSIFGYFFGLLLGHKTVTFIYAARCSLLTPNYSEISHRRAV